MAANTTTTRSHYEEVTSTRKGTSRGGFGQSTTQSVYGGPTYTSPRPGSRGTKYSTSSEYGGTRRRNYHSGVTKKDIDAMASELGPEFISQRMNEKENLKNLNNRFASYIEKVRNLEIQNKALEVKRGWSHRARCVPPSSQKSFKIMAKPLPHARADPECPPSWHRQDVRGRDEEAPSRGQRTH